ncbi:MAG: NAD(P)H-dependent oxidoreductase subunit E [Clostridiales bacterium]|nr:NAD(P)H-dependent oxidoreductase subunit E [Clostridiales bacterium]
MSEHCEHCEHQEKFAQLQQVIDRMRGEQGALMPVLQGAQEIFGCVPIDVQKYIAREMHVTLSQIYGVATFYSQFALETNGKYVISMCMGTACYVKGSQAVLDKLGEVLGLKSGETSADGKFTLDATRCLGACGLAPVMTINEDVHGRLTPDAIPGILAKYQEG